MIYKLQKLLLKEKHTLQKKKLISEDFFFHPEHGGFSINAKQKQKTPQYIQYMLSSILDPQKPWVKPMTLPVHSGVSLAPKKPAGVGAPLTRRRQCPVRSARGRMHGQLSIEGEAPRATPPFRPLLPYKITPGG